MIENVVMTIDYILDSDSKRHIVGGILLSASFLFAGLAITVMTMSEDNKKKENNYE